MARYKVGDTVYVPYVDLENEIIRVDSDVIEEVGICDSEVEWYHVFDSLYMDNELCSSYKEAADCCKARYESHVKTLKRQIERL